MVSFLTIHRGETVRTAKVVTVSSDPELVAEVATRLLEEGQAQNASDPVLSALDEGRTRALRIIQLEAPHATNA